MRDGVPNADIDRDRDILSDNEISNGADVVHRRHQFTPLHILVIVLNLIILNSIIHHNNQDIAVGYR